MDDSAIQLKVRNDSSDCCSCCGGREAHKHENEEDEEEEEEKSSSSDLCSGCCCCCRRRRRRRHKSPVRTKSPPGSRHRCLVCCKTFATFMFSHVGLCSLVVGYSILGGFIFRELESPHELKERNAVSVLRKRHVSRLWNLTEELNVLHAENWSRIAEEVLATFQMEVFVAIKEKGWDGKDGKAELQWSFAGALLYSVTVITTIGYGHIAPKTEYGRVVTIAYALFGIPLTLLCLANLGSFFGKGFRLFYKHTCRILCCLCRSKDPRPPAARTRHRRQPAEGLHGDETHPLRDAAHEKATTDIEKCDTTVMVDDGRQKNDKEEVRVPIVVSVFIIAVYISGGAVLFSLWEEDWDYLVGSYFCFITLSTVGFGDFVPGTSIDSWKNQEKLILCAIYLVFGLSLIAMCFDLMQEEVRAKFNWLGKRVGIIDEKE